MNKLTAMLFLLTAEAEANERGNTARAAEIRADYLLFCDGFYDEYFKETISRRNTASLTDGTGR